MSQAGPTDAQRPMDEIENLTFEELRVGAKAELTLQLDARALTALAALPGQVNPGRVDAALASSDDFHRLVAHAIWSPAMIWTVAGTMLPGPGSVCLSQSLRYLRPLQMGDSVKVHLQVAEVDRQKRHVKLDCVVTNQHYEQVVSGSLKVQAPLHKLRRQAQDGAPVQEQGRLLRELVARAARAAPLATAVVWPLDAGTLQATQAATQAGLITARLIGPAAAIAACAQKTGLAFDPALVDEAPDSHSAAALAISMARSGAVRAVMQGSLDGSILLAEVSTGLRTVRRLSHACLVDVSAYRRPVIVTDCAWQATPDLAAKADIVRNAIELAQAIGIRQPRVAVLAARELIDPQLVATVDAAALCKMAERGQIGAALVDGPMHFASAVSPRTADARHLPSQVAGHADIVLVPNLEAGHLLMQQLEEYCGAQCAAIVLGAEVPVLALPRADGAQASLAACALASLMAAHTPYRQAPA